MTGLVQERAFSRRSFLKSGGALVVGFSVAGSLAAGKAGAATGAGIAAGPPNPAQIDTWIVVHPDNTVSVNMGKVGNGTGTDTGTAAIAAEELYLPMSMLKLIRWNSVGPNPSPSQGPTVGSNGVASGGVQVRAAAAAAYQALAGLASTQLGVPVGGLSAANGVISGGGKSVSYGQLLGDKLFNVKMTTVTANNTISATNPQGNLAAGGSSPGDTGTKPVSQYTLVGTAIPRIDIPAKVIGTFTYVHNIRLPGMLHGRVVRPRGQALYRAGTSAVVSVDESSVAHISGVQVLRKGDFIGVVAPHEYDAIQAAAVLKVQWANADTLPGSGNLWQAIRNTPASEIVRIATKNVGNVDAALAGAAKSLAQTYEWPVHIHGVIGPSCAIADVRGSNATVIAQFQGGYDRLQPSLAQTLGFASPRSIQLVFYEGSSTYGHNCSDHAAIDAAIMSQLVGKPVRVQYMRWDEHGWDNYAPPVLMDLRAGIDANNKVVAWDVTAWEPPAPGTVQAPGTQELGFPIGPVATSVIVPAANGEPYGTASLSSVSAYQPTATANWRVTTNSTRMLFRFGTMRGPGFNQPSFANEQMMDELAYAAGMDPVQFRLNHVTDPRWMAVLTAVTQAANWQPKVASSVKQTGNVVKGRGISLTVEQSYGSVIADVSVNMKTGKVSITHLYAAQENGMTVGPDLVKNQMSGSMIQAASRTIQEQETFNKKRITGLDWVTYPILRFADHPSVTTVLIQRMDQPNLGAGEALHPAPAPAIANAFFDATGVRMRSVPLSPARVRAALKAAGKG
ncbi:MAG TPA: molybdopterin cofactor-binding domain-containing protein [Gaiellaceae bacterium]|jgi:CO/xanthine dehydrogenase Mo-binding subunit|nr:molybdopterin cofactor-binding domain-containing protein [Gaiellaceae bacterium]